MPFLRAANTQLTANREKSWLVASCAAGASSITVADYSQFAVSQILLIGNFGDERSEVIITHASTTPTSAGVITLKAGTTTTFAHSIDDPVTVIGYNFVEFSRTTVNTTLTTAATTASTTLYLASTTGLAASGTVIIGDGTDDEVTYTAISGNTLTGVSGVSVSHAVGAAVWQPSVLTAFSGTPIEADDQNTTYNDTTNTTGYGLIRFVNYPVSTATYSKYSELIPYTTPPANAVRRMKDAALAVCHEQISDTVTEEFLLNELNNFQRDVDSQKDWSWQLTSYSDEVVSGQKDYDLPGDIKYTASQKGVLQVYMHDNIRLEYVDKEEYEILVHNDVSTSLAAGVAVTDTTISLTDGTDFADSGTIVIGDDEITYTGKSTNTLTGVDDIDSTHTAGDTVWQDSSLGQPVRYTIYEGHLYLEPVASTDFDEYSLTYNYYRSIPELTSDVSETIIPFFHLSQYYLAWKIEIMKGNKDMADYWRQIFENRLAGEMRRDRSGQEARFIPILSGWRPKR